MNQRQRKRKHGRRAQHAQEARTPDRPALLISGSNCQKVDNGHIVPRTYQRAWEGEHRQVAVHCVGSLACRPRSTRVVGARGPFYRRTRPRNGVEIDDIEASLAHLENKASPTLRQVIAGKPLTAERKAALAQLFGVQIVRGPAFITQYEEIQHSVLANATSSDFKPKHLAAVAGDVDLARDQVLEALVDPTSRLVTMLSYGPKVAGILSLMRWHILHFDGPLLAYSDQPVVMWPMNVDRTIPFRQQVLGPLTMLEIRVPIAPNTAILMNWIHRNDEGEVAMKRWAAAELNAFTVAQADQEWMHSPGNEPVIADDIFSPLSRLIDPTYDRVAAESSARRAHALKFQARTQKRKWVNDLEVIVNLDERLPRKRETAGDARSPGGRPAG